MKNSGKTMLLAIAAFTVFSSSCEKQETDYCNYKGRIEYHCIGSLSTSYEVYMNSAYLRNMNAGNVALYDVDTGWYQLTYTGGPVESVHVGPCETVIYQFPK